MWKIIFLSLMAGVVFAAEPSPVNPAALTKRNIQVVKKSDSWVSMTNQLAQYDAHYVDATNKIAQVTDDKTRTALTKSLKATDDCHDALVKLIKCFKDCMKADE